MKNNKFYALLDKVVPNPKCELNYNKDYELLIAVMLSAQCSDKRVNEVTEKLFEKYSLEDLSALDEKEIIKEIYVLGAFNKKAHYTKIIAQRLIKDHQGHVPNDRNFLESLPGVGRKTCNVVLSELFDEPTIAVDTHVERVSKRLGIAQKNDDVTQVEKKLMKYLEPEKYNKVNHQLVLLGRYTCTAKKPKCENCALNIICPKKGIDH